MRIGSLLFCFAFLLSNYVLAQDGGLRGKIRSNTGEALSYASIYVKETGTGTVSNDEGQYEIRLEPGDYTVIYQYLGYQAQSERVSIGNRFKDLNIELSKEVLELETIEVLDGGEDPAYTVMRKAIAKADYHRQQVDYYKAQVYIKGSGRLLKSPFFVRKRLAKEGIDSTVAFTSESVSIIEYERPSTFREKVISVYTQGDDNSVDANSYINGSFYEPTIAESISPLSPRAFAYYKFKLEGYFQDRGYAVNKIKVTPRSRGDDVFEGFIYIVEDLWSIHSLDLSTYKLGIKFDVSQIYAPILETVWLPVSATFDIVGSILGFKFEYRYLATLADYEVKVNPDLTYDFKVIDEKIDKELAKEVKKKRANALQDARNAEEKLAGGDELTRKELRKLMREYEREDDDKRKEEENAPPVESVYEYSVDSLAGKRDSLYWAKIRPVPLTAVESKGYAVRDSISQREKEKEEEGLNETSRRRRTGSSPIGALLFGKEFRLDKGKYIFYDSPLFDVQFNPVEGFNATGSLGYRASGDNRLKVWVDGHYAFERNVFNYRGNLEYRFGKKHSRDSIAISGGRYVAQYNENRPVPELLNTFSALFNERNFVQIFEKDFVKVSYTKKWWKTARLNVGAEYAQRRGLVNRTTQTFFNRDDREYSPNFPNFTVPLPDLPDVDNQNALILNLGFQVRPWQKYVLRNGKRRARSRPSPLFALNYRKGLPDFAESTSDFDHLDFIFKHSFKVGVRGKVHFKANAGTFFNSNNIAPTDFKHFAGNQMAFTTSDPVGSFRLLPYYQYSTIDNYAALSLHYQFRKFLLTRIWEVQLLGIRENFFVNYLHTPRPNFETQENYVELGYSIDNILRFFRVELITAFEDGKYYDFGVRIGIASSLFGGMVSVE